MVIGDRSTANNLSMSEQANCIEYMEANQEDAFRKRCQEVMYKW